MPEVQSGTCARASSRTGIVGAAGGRPTPPRSAVRRQVSSAVAADLAIGGRRGNSSARRLALAAILHGLARVTCLVDVGLLPCGRGDGLVGAGLDAFDVQLAPLGRVPRQLCVVLDVGGEVAEILRFLSIREIRGHLEHFGADHEAGSEVLVVASLRLALVALSPLGVAVDERGAHHGGIRACLQHLDVVPLTQLLADASLGVTGGLVFVADLPSWAHVPLHAGSP